MSGPPDPDRLELTRRWELVWPHRDRLIAIARSRVASVEDAEDCVAEAMLRAVQYDGLDETRVGAFLCTVVMRLTVDTHRDAERLRRASTRLGSRDTAAAPFDDAVCERDEARWLAERLADAKGRERQLIDARRDGHSVTEAAAHLGITTKAAENAWTRVRGKAGRLLATTLAVTGTAAATLGRTLRRVAAPAAVVPAAAFVALVLANPPTPTPAPAADVAPSDETPDPVTTSATRDAAAPPRAGRVGARPASAAVVPPAAPRPPRATASAAPVVEVPAQSVPGVVDGGGTRVTREREDEPVGETVLRCAEGLRPDKPLEDPCDDTGVDEVRE